MPRVKRKNATNEVFNDEATLHTEATPHNEAIAYDEATAHEEAVLQDEATPRVRKRPRKKQAVTKTSSATVKALIRKNAETSPLLTFPSEVRENILSHLIGDKLIHLKYLSKDDASLAKKAEKEYLGTSANGRESGKMPIHFMLNSDDEIEVTDNGEIWTREPGLFSPFPAEAAGREPGLFSPLSAEAVSSAMADSPLVGATFRHAICVAKQSEESAYEEVISRNTIVPNGELPELYVPSCKERHANCKICGDGPKFLLKEDQPALKLDLNVLGVCRQLYEEANHLLWATNTFSFDDPNSFDKFFASLNPAQKHNLANIHISANIGTAGSYTSSATSQRSRYDPGYWGRALKVASLNKLRGIRSLHLCLNQVFECLDRDGMAVAAPEKAIEEAHQADMAPILRLRALSVKHVTVIVSDDGDKLEMLGRGAHRWTAIKKSQYAESIRVQLVDPTGADSVKTEAEAASHARKVEIRDRAEAKLESVKRTLGHIEADAVRSEEWAIKEEARAEKAEQEADRAATKVASIKKPFKKTLLWAAKLQDAADTQRDAARAQRERANLAVGRVEHWQAQVDTARNKHRRAMISLGATPQDLEFENEVEDLLPGPDQVRDEDLRRNDTNEDWRRAADTIIQSEDDETVVAEESIQSDDDETVTAEEASGEDESEDGDLS